MTERDELADPRRIETIADLEWLFRDDPHTRARTTCAWCESTARRNLEQSREWFRHHECMESAGRKELPALAPSEARHLAAGDERLQFWAAAQRSQVDLLDPESFAPQIDLLATRVASERRFDVVANGRTLKGGGSVNAVIERLERVEERLNENLRVSEAIVKRLQTQQSGDAPVRVEDRNADVVDLDAARVRLRRAA